MKKQRILPSSWTEEQNQYLLDNFRTMPYYLIAEKIGRTRSAVQARAFVLKLERTKEERDTINRTFNRGILKKGNKPWNAGMKGIQIGGKQTQFRKGQLPHNTREDGALSKRKDSGGRYYWHIRTDLGKWEYLHRVKWQAANGPIPKGKILRCKTGDTLNTDPGNWYLTDRKKHMGLNSGPLNLSDTYVAATMTVRQPELRQELIKHPEIIEVQRKNMLLKREIKKQQLSK